MKTTLIIILTIYMFFWILSTFILITELSDKDYRGTKKDVLLTILIPFYTTLRKAIKSFKQLD